MSGATDVPYSNSRTGLVKENWQDFCEGCISREKTMIFKSSTLDTEKLEQCRKRIKEQIEEGVVLLPYYIDLISPQEPKTGHWEWVKYENNPNIGNWHCSECNRIVCGAITAANPVYAYKYCPNCGAKMEG